MNQTLLTAGMIIQNEAFLAKAMMELAQALSQFVPTGDLCQKIEAAASEMDVQAKYLLEKGGYVAK